MTDCALVVDTCFANLVLVAVAAATSTTKFGASLVVGVAFLDRVATAAFCGILWGPRRQVQSCLVVMCVLEVLWLLMLMIDHTVFVRAGVIIGLAFSAVVAAIRVYDGVIAEEMQPWSVMGWWWHNGFFCCCCSSDLWWIIEIFDLPQESPPAVTTDFEVEIRVRLVL